jgi:hypothetical protein
MKVELPAFEFELSDKDMIAVARRVARDSIKAACRDAVLAKQLDALEDVPVTTLSQETYKAGLLKLVQIATADEVEVTDSDGDTHKVPNSQQLRALEVLMQHRIEEGKLLLQAQAQTSPVAAGGGNLRPIQITASTLDEMQRITEEENIP